MITHAVITHVAEILVSLFLDILTVEGVPEKVGEGTTAVRQAPSEVEADIPPEVYEGQTGLEGSKRFLLFHSTALKQRGQRYSKWQKKLF